MFVQVILSPTAKKTLDFLTQESEKNKQAKTMVRAIEAKIELIKQNPNYGHPIAKRLIPPRYKEEYGITNLFQVTLPQYWRMLYSTIRTQNQIELLVTILETVDHPT